MADPECTHSCADLEELPLPDWATQGIVSQLCGDLEQPSDPLWRLAQAIQLGAPLGRPLTVTVRNPETQEGKSYYVQSFALGIVVADRDCLNLVTVIPSLGDPQEATP